MEDTFGATCTAVVVRETFGLLDGNVAAMVVLTDDTLLLWLSEHFVISWEFSSIAKVETNETSSLAAVFNLRIWLASDTTEEGEHPGSAFGFINLRGDLICQKSLDGPSFFSPVSSLIDTTTAK